MICCSKKCEVEFEPKNSIQRYCSSTCQTRESVTRFRMARRKPCPECGHEINFQTILCKDCHIIRKLGESKPWQQRTISEYRSRRSHQWHSQIRDISRKIYHSAYPNSACKVCGYNKHIEVCHIKAINDFDENTELSIVNDIINLIGLCRNCHWELDNGILQI